MISIICLFASLLFRANGTTQRLKQWRIHLTSQYISRLNRRNVMYVRLYVCVRVMFSTGAHERSDGKHRW